MSIRDEIREQRMSLKGKGVKAHVSWFWSYYKWPVAIIILSLILVISVVYSIVTRKPEAANVIMLNVEGQSSLLNTDPIVEDIADKADVDLDEYSISLDMSGHLTPGGATDSAEIGQQERIVTYISAKNLDVLACDAYNFVSYANIGAFVDLRTVLSDEEIEKYEPYFYYVDEAVVDAEQDSALSGSSEEDSSDITGETQEEAEASKKVGTFKLPDPSKMEDPEPVGIVLNDAPYSKNMPLYTETTGMIGIVSTSQHMETSVAIINYFWEGPDK